MKTDEGDCRTDLQRTLRARTRPVGRDFGFLGLIDRTQHALVIGGTGFRRREAMRRAHQQPDAVHAGKLTTARLRGSRAAELIERLGTVNQTQDEVVHLLRHGALPENDAPSSAPFPRQD